MKRPQQLLFVLLGTGFWLNAALIIRFTGARVFSAGNPNLVWFFGLAVPLTLLSLYLTALVSKRSWQQLLEPVVVMTFTATFWDAIALTWFRALYSQSYEVALHGAAWILWGAGLGLLLSYAFHQAQGVGRAVGDPLGSAPTGSQQVVFSEAAPTGRG